MIYERVLYGLLNSTARINYHQSHSFVFYCTRRCMFGIASIVPVKRRGVSNRNLYSRLYSSQWKLRARLMFTLCCSQQRDSGVTFVNKLYNPISTPTCHMLSSCNMVSVKVAELGEDGFKNQHVYVCLQIIFSYSQEGENNIKMSLISQS